MSVLIQGNVIINGSNIIGPQQAPLLDTYTGAAAAYSLRKLRSAYTGNAIRVRRSADNAESNIGFDGVGNLNEQALLNFVGAGSAYVTTWYDQTTNASNASQSTQGYQPRIVNSGVIEKINNRPTIYFDGVDDRMTAAGVIVSQPDTIFSVLRVNSLAPSINFYDATTASARQALFSNAGVYGYYAGLASVQSITLDTNIFLSTALFNGASSRLYRNGSLATSGNPGTYGINNFQISGFGSGAILIGNVSEIVIYSSDQSTNRNSIESNINTYFNIY